MRAPDKRTFEFVASGGVDLSGSAVIAFIPAKITALSGHGAGFLVTRTTGIPIRRWQYEYPRVVSDSIFETGIYRASGGIKYGGAAGTGYTPGALVREREEEDAILLLLAAA